MSNETKTKTAPACDMQAWQEKNQPNEHHEHLLKSVGEWSVEGKFFMVPGEPPLETEGTSTITAILNGRFLKHDYASTFGGAPFNGLGIDGYDNIKERYVSLWTDTMSTGFCILEGEREGNVTTTFGESRQPDGSTKKSKSVGEYKDDVMNFSMYSLEGDDWRLTMELVYRRKPT